MDKSIGDFNIRLRTIKLRDLFLGIIIAIILTGLLMATVPQIYESDELTRLTFLIIGLLLFGYALKGTTGLKNNFKNIFVPNTQKEILYVFLLNIIFAFLFMFFISSLDIIFGLTDPTWISIWDIDTVDIDSTILIFDLITSIIFAPIIEELFFRGVLFNRLKIRTGLVPAMIISSILFAIGHDFGGIISAFLFGICMCILYLKTDNILVPMSIHFINNLAATILEFSGIDVFMAQFPWIIPSLIITLIATVLLMKYIIEETRKLKEQYN